MKLSYSIILSISFVLLIFFNSCKKENTVPVISESSVNNVTEFTATCNATISDDGGGEITVRGFVWDTVANPDLSTNFGLSENGTGTGDFTNSLTNLNFETAYYVKAYATNEVGTVYGDELVFTTNDLVWNGASCTDCETVTDIDGNAYRTVSVGDQCWLVENLKTTKLNDGTDITNVTENGDWNSISSSAYSWYENDIGNKDTDGAIYNYYAVATDKLCPTGWHVATDNEWKELEGTVDTQYDAQDDVWNGQSWRGNDAGDKLKKRIGWYESGNGVDEYGFEVLPNGFRNAVTGEFEHKTEWGTIWTHKNTDETEHFRREFSHQDENIARYNCSPRSGYAVRCLKD